jgi:hypothetical protein
VKCNETQGKWCKNKHGASKIIDTFETYQLALLVESLTILFTVAEAQLTGWQGTYLGRQANKKA